MINIKLGFGYMLKIGGNFPDNGINVGYYGKRLDNEFYKHSKKIFESMTNSGLLMGEKV